jgi:hypothetical protein
MTVLNAAKQEFHILRVQPLRDFNSSWRDVYYSYFHAICMYHPIDP